MLATALASKCFQILFWVAIAVPKVGSPALSPEFFTQEWLWLGTCLVVFNSVSQTCLCMGLFHLGVYCF